MDVSIDGKIVLSLKRKFKLSELIAKCDPNAHGLIRKKALAYTGFKNSRVRIPKK
jgi:hypothetical protein